MGLSPKQLNPVWPIPCQLGFPPCFVRACLPVPRACDHEFQETVSKEPPEAATLCGEMATTQRLSNSAQYWERMLFGQGSNNHCRLQSTNSIIHILHICKGWIQPVCGLQILQFLIFQFEPKNGVLEIILPQKHYVQVLPNFNRHPRLCLEVRWNASRRRPDCKTRAYAEQRPTW